MDTAFPQFIPLTSSQDAHTPGPGMTVYIDAAPYPEVKGAHDPAAVAILKEDYAGAHGELTGILQYIFQQGRIEDNEALSNALLQIAIVEMTHLDMLGDAIVALGGNPSFDDGKYYWDASKVNYATGLKDMLAANIASEETAIADYERHAALMKNESVKALLERIIKDERLHLRFFRELAAAL